MNPERPHTNTANTEAQELLPGRVSSISCPPSPREEAAEAQRQGQQHCGLKKCDEVLNLKLLNASSSSGNDDEVSADCRKIAHLESHLLETQRRSEETQAILEAKLERALETNRVLRIENSLKLDEMQNRIKFLEDEIETEEWCNEVVTWMRDDMEKNRRHDKLSMISSHYGRVVRERDNRVRELERTCERKDHAVETLTSELRDVKEEARRLKLAEAARLALPMSAQLLSKQPIAAAAAIIPQRALRRNSAHASCA